MDFYCQEHDYVGKTRCTTCEEIDAAKGIAPKSTEDYILEACGALTSQFGGAAFPLPTALSNEMLDKMLLMGCDMEDVGLVGTLVALQPLGYRYSTRGANKKMLRMAKSLCDKGILMRRDGDDTLVVLPIEVWEKV